METLPPVENAQFASPSVAVPSVAPAPEASSSPKFSQKPIIFVAMALLLGAIVITAFWFFSRESSLPTSLSPGLNDEFSQTTQPLEENTSVNTIGNIREDSPGFVGGRAEEGQSANADGCTLDTQTCSDGTIVERQGPSCEFAACPAEVTVTVQPGWTAYKNTRYKYSFSYPSDWVAKEDGAVSDANSSSSFVQVFRPGDEAVEDSFNGVYIESTDLLPPDLTEVTMNGIPMWRQEGSSGVNYFVSIPGTEEYLFIVGGEGNTGDAARDAVIREIFSTFRVQ